MNGAHKRYMQRETKKTFHQSMDLYERTLQQVVNASPSGRIPQQDGNPLSKTIRVGEPVAVRCSDNSDFYRTVLIRKNQFSNSYQALISNPVAATIPPGMDEVSQEQVFKRIRDLNASFTSGSDLRAFPYRTGSATPQQNFDFSHVTPLHQQQQKRGQR